MALLTFNPGDSWYDILRKIVINQNGPYTPSTGDNEWSLWRKFLLNQNGNLQFSSYDNKYNLLYKIVSNSADTLGAGGVYPNIYDSWVNLMQKFLSNEAAAAPAIPSFILTESGGYILLEDGVSKIQLES